MHEPKITLKRGILFAILFAVVVVMFIAPLCGAAVVYGGQFDGGLISYDPSAGSYEAAEFANGYRFSFFALLGGEWCYMDGNGALSQTSGSFAEYVSYAQSVGIEGAAEFEFLCISSLITFFVAFAAMVAFFVELSVKNSVARKIVNGVCLGLCFVSTVIYATAYFAFGGVVGVGAGLSVLPAILVALLAAGYVCVQIFVREKTPQGV